MIGADELAEHHPMIDPVVAHEHEAEGIHQVAAPLLRQQGQEAGAGIMIGGVGNANDQDQQGNTEGEDPVAERLDPRRAGIGGSFGAVGRM